MRSPFDIIVRIERRNVDGLRVAIQATVGEIDALENAADQLETLTRDECETAASDWGVSTFDWLRARSRDAARIVQDRQEQEDHLARLRGQASAAYGALRTAENAVDRHRAEAQRRRDAKVQAEADDLSNMRRLLAQRRAHLRGLRSDTR